MGKMSSQLLAEAFLCQSEASALPFNQSTSVSQASSLIAAKVQSSVVLLNPNNFQPQQCLHTAVVPAYHGTDSAHQNADHATSIGTAAIQGLAFSSYGSHLAAYSSTRVFVATLDAAAAASHSSTSSRQTHQASNAAGAAAIPQGVLQQAAVVPEGIKSVHWCPTGDVLAVCSRDKAAVTLYVLPDSHTHNKQQQQGVPLLTQVLTLTGPSQKGPLAATWLPAAHSLINSSSSNGSDRSNGGQVPTLSSNVNSNGSSTIDSSSSSINGVCHQATGSNNNNSSSSRDKAAYPMLGLLLSWPRHLQLTIWTQQQGTCDVNWVDHVTHTILTGWPGTPRTLLALTRSPPDAAAAAAAAAAIAGGGGVGGRLGGSGKDPAAAAGAAAAAAAAAGNGVVGATEAQQQQQQASVCGTQVMVVAAVEPELAWSAAATAAQQMQVSRPPSQQPAAAAAAAAAVSPLPPMAAAVGAPPAATSTAAVGASSGSSGVGGSVLDSLMNIGSPQTQQVEGALRLLDPFGPPKIQLLEPSAPPAAAAAGGGGGGGGAAAAAPAAGGVGVASNGLDDVEAAGSVLGGSSGSSSSSSAQAAPSSLCLLVLDLARLNSQQGPSRQIPDTTRAAASHTEPASPSARAQHMDCTKYINAQRSECVTVLPLPQQPLPRFLAGQGSLVAVGSGAGCPRVTLASVSASRGLQMLQTVEVPMPRAVAAAAAVATPGGGSSGGKQARLQGLLLLPTGGPHNAPDAAGAAAGADGNKAAAAAGAAGTAGAAADVSHGRLVALLACSDKPSAHIGGFLYGIGGSKKGPGSVVDMYMVQLQIEAQQQEQQQLQLQHQQQFQHAEKASTGQAAAQQQQLQQAAAQQQQQQQQELWHAAQQEEQQHAHQQEVQQQQVDGSSAVVAALQALQLSLEGRLDAMQTTLLRMEQRLEALERKTER